MFLYFAYGLTEIGHGIRVAITYKYCARDSAVVAHRSSKGHVDVLSRMP